MATIKLSQPKWFSMSKVISTPPYANEVCTIVQSHLHARKIVIELSRENVVFVSLIAGHAVVNYRHSLNLRCLLNDGAERTEQVKTAVLACATFDSLCLPDLGSHLHSGDAVSNWNQRETTAQEATLSYSLRVLANNIAWKDPCDYT